MGGRLAAIVATVGRRPVGVLAACLALILAGGLLALRLSPSAATDTLVSASTPAYQATARYHRIFGEDAVIVLVRGRLSDLVLTSDIERVLGLEGCMGGRPPQGVEPRGGPRGPCAELARTKPVKVVYGPGTFINESVAQIADAFTAQKNQAQAQATTDAQAALKLALARGMSRAQATRLAGQAAQLRQAQFFKDTLQLALKYGITGVPTLNDPSFVSKLVFSDSAKVGTPKTRFAYLFPTPDSALIQVRLRPGLSERQRADAIAQIQRAVRMPDWGLKHGQRYVVTGVPVVVNDLTNSISRSIVVLLIAALLVMGGTLALVFRAPARLLPLGVALGAAALTFGALSLAGASLTMASIAVLPVLIGLAVDYAIQFQSRVAEAGGDAPRAARLGGPTLLTAGSATAAGFLALGLSPVPMVRGFGLLLVVGIVLALLSTFTAGAALLALERRRAPRRGPAPWAAPARMVAPAWRGAVELLTETRLPRAVASRARALGDGALRLATTRPERVLAVALAVAVVGLVADTQTPVQSDVQKLVPQNMQALRDLRALEASTGVGGEIDVVVQSSQLTEPATVAWMTSYQQGLLKRYGYSAARGCGRAELCPAFSLPDLFSGGAMQSRSQIEGLLGAVPPYFSQGVISPDHRTATLAFGIRLMALDEQERVIDTMRRELHPPAGVRAEVAGLPVLAADANAQLASPWRRLLQLVLSLLAVAFVLLVALRGVRRALLPLAPIALVTGWSGLALWLLSLVGIPLNPMSVTLGALVIAISTEFSVLLSERYRQERADGHGSAAALERTYASTGRAVMASGLTAIAGFAVLVVSDISMLRNFGLVTVVDLTISLLGVLVVLPAALLAEERGLRLPQLPLPRRMARARP